MGDVVLPEAKKAGLCLLRSQPCRAAAKNREEFLL
jgi:hypothetical protein